MKSVDAHRQDRRGFEPRGSMVYALSEPGARRAARVLACTLCALVILSASGGWGQTCDLKPDEEMVFFPSMGYRVGGGAGWDLEIRGCVYEPESRRVALEILEQALRVKGVKMSAAEEATFKDRARLFMVDHEHGKKVVVRVGHRIIELGKSLGDGTFSGVVRLSDSEVNELELDGRRIEAVLAQKDQRRFVGEVTLADEVGLTVISDIDDTIKVTSVSDRSAMLRSSFLEPFRPVPGMAEVYSGWATNSGAQFWYVSASPWQLFAPLSEFVRSHGFPAGVFCLKQVRLKNKSVMDLFESPQTYKSRVIEPLMKRFPHRRFVLVGDSGEHDPEIYARLARQFPGQVGRIFIRDVTGDPANSARYRQAFQGLAPDLWQVFGEPAAIAPMGKL